jgi:toxin-antitoxin system PIN domain toxin
MLVDANLLLFAVDTLSPFHDRARTWLTEALNGDQRVGLPWQSLTAFLRISTHPRAATNPLRPEDAWQQVQEWLTAELAWVPLPTSRHADVLGGLLTTYQLSGNAVPDAVLAALCIEHGLVIYSADTDFARFAEISWRNPLNR